MVSLPYHHPWLVADRLVLLDHLTRGRVIFGAGPGALPTDAYIMGIDPVDQRRMMEESLEAILALLRSDEPVSRETDWFTIRDGRLQVRPYTHPHPEVAVAAMVSPSGPRLAGTHDVSLLSLSMSVFEGFAAIGKAWSVVEEMARAAGQPAPDRQTWRVLGTMHIAETRDQAIEDCTYGLEDFANYFGGGAGFVPLANASTAGRRPRGSSSRPTPTRATSSSAPPTTPSPTSRACSSSREASARSSCWATTGPTAEATMRSYRLFAREVIPHFKGQLAAPRASHDWAVEQAGRAVRASRPGDPERHHVPREEAQADGNAAGGDGEAKALMRAPVLSHGEHGRARRRRRARARLRHGARRR